MWSSGVDERSLRPRRRVSYVSFFAARAKRGAVGLMTPNTTTSNTTRSSEYSLEEMQLLTPGIGGPASKAKAKAPVLAKRNISVSTPGIQLKIGRYQSTTPPKSLPSSASSACSWRSCETYRRKKGRVSRRINLIPFPLDHKLFDIRRLLKVKIVPSKALVRIMEQEKRYAVHENDIAVIQRGRWTLDTRKELVILIYKVMNACDCDSEIGYIAENIMSRFLSRNYVHSKSQRHTVAISSALIAIKFLDEEDPIIVDILTQCGSALSKQQILGMERRIVKSLEWELHCPTPYTVGYNILDSLPINLPFELKKHIVNMTNPLIVAYCAEGNGHISLALAVAVGLSIALGQVTPRVPWNRVLSSLIGLSEHDFMAFKAKASHELEKIRRAMRSSL